LRISSSPINKNNNVPLDVLLSKSEELLKHDNQIAKLPSGTIDYVFNGDELVVIETHLMAAVGIASYAPIYWIEQYKRLFQNKCVLCRAVVAKYATTRNSLFDARFY
jgi:hypothetical protein